jgi:hypothetical protein
MKSVFAEIIAIPNDDGLRFDTGSLKTTTIRDEMEYGGVRLRLTAYLERTSIPVVIDIGFGDALAAAPDFLAYPTLLEMDAPRIRSYPPATVIAEKFQAMVALGVANGRMKDYYDLWALPKALAIDADDLDAAIRATFDRRRTEIPRERPPGLSHALLDDDVKQRQWHAYAASIDLSGITLDEVVEAIWELVGPSCARLTDGG